jgi:hypothetical protein
MRVIRTVPTVREQTDAEFRAYDKWSKEVLRELARLGYTVDHWTYNREPEPVGGRLYLRDVGRDRMLLVLRYAPRRLDGIRIERVAFGRGSWTARQAALWLRKKAPLVPRYLR